MLKSLLIAVIVLPLLPVAFFRVWVGVLLWSWLGYMNPHRLTFGFAYSFPWSQLVAVATLGGLLISRDRKPFPLNGITISWLALLLWFGVTTLFALYPTDAHEQMVKVYKIQLIALITVVVMCDRKHMDMLIWVIIGSIGYFTVKGGVFTLLTGGSFRVWGPPGSFIEGNNELAVAGLMIIPLMHYLKTMSDNRFVQWGLLFCMLFGAISAAGSQSRGAMLAGLSMSFFLWMKSKQKLRSAVALIVLLPAIGLFMPQHYWDRMATIFEQNEEGKHENSAQQRIDMWVLIYRLANDRPLGGGFNFWGRQEIATKYIPESPWGRHAAHSIYFSILGEHGWVGLGLFLLLFANTWFSCTRVIRQSRDNNHLKWADSLARCVQVSLIAYASGGAFLSLSYFDLPYHLVAITVILQVLVQQQLAARSVQSPVRQEEQPGKAVGEVATPTLPKNPGPRLVSRPLILQRSRPTQYPPSTTSPHHEQPESGLQTRYRFLGSGMIGCKPSGDKS